MNRYKNERHILGYSRGTWAEGCIFIFDSFISLMLTHISLPYFESEAIFVIVYDEWFNRKIVIVIQVH